MILIAIAIILLCMYLLFFSNSFKADTSTSTSPCRLLILLSHNTGHIPHLPVLQILPSELRALTGRPWRYDSNRKYCWPSTLGSPSWVLRNLHKPRRRCISLLE